MTDTGRERASTWPFVNGFIRPALKAVGLELQIVKAADFARLDVYWNGDVLLPGYTNQSGSDGKLSPFCSGKWKRDVAERWFRSVGIETCRNWIGISRDEARRIRTPHRAWIDLWYPLIFEVPLTRQACIELIRVQGWTDQIPHSACYMCPNHSNAEWIDMKLHWPSDFTAACGLEAETRVKDPHFFLHASMRPLSEVDFFAQQSLLSERGCYEGCFT